LRFRNPSDRQDLRDTVLPEQPTRDASPHLAPITLVDITSATQLESRPHKE